MTNVAFSPDGKRIVTGGVDQMVRVWDAASGQEVLTLKGDTAGVYSVAFSPDGTRLVTGVPQGAKVWDAEPLQATWPLPDAAERQAYHTEQAALAVQQKQWFAAEFHLGHVLRDDSENVAVKTRRAEVASHQKKFALATRRWAKVLASDPKLGDDRQTQPRYHAARAAVQAAAGHSRGRAAGGGGEREPPPPGPRLAEGRTDLPGRTTGTRSTAESIGYRTDPPRMAEGRRPGWHPRHGGSGRTDSGRTAGVHVVVG